LAHRKASRAHPSPHRTAFQENVLRVASNFFHVKMHGKQQSTSLEEHRQLEASNLNFQIPQRKSTKDIQVEDFELV
jgi:hypothetical protein